MYILTDVRYRNVDSEMLYLSQRHRRQAPKIDSATVAPTLFQSTPGQSEIKYSGSALDLNSTAATPSFIEQSTTSASETPDAVTAVNSTAVRPSLHEATAIATFPVSGSRSHSDSNTVVPSGTVSNHAATTTTTRLPVVSTANNTVTETVVFKYTI